jgi:hypothetical protein
MIEERILSEVMKAARENSDWHSLGLFGDGSSAIGVHLAVMVEPFLTYIIEGKKTIESRFSKPLIAPYKRIAEKDVVLLKAGPVVASFRVTTVEFIELNDTERQRLVCDYSSAICADSEFWAAREDKNYATLVGISDVRRLTPVKVSKNDRRGWLVLRDGAHEHEQLSFM